MTRREERTGTAGPTAQKGAPPSNLNAKVTSIADHCVLSVSTVITGDNHALQSAEPSESLQVTLLPDSSPIQLSLLTQS
jgi:hypothetical protein